MVIYPYRLNNMWVFDDPSKNLKAEAFVRGASEAIDALVKRNGIVDTSRGIKLEFGEDDFSDWATALCRVRRKSISDLDGTVYDTAIDGVGYELWLCPALLCYFDEPPLVIYVLASELPASVDPVWDDGSEGEAYVYGGES